MFHVEHKGMNAWDDFVAGLEPLGIALSVRQTDLFLAYWHELKRWGKAVHLVSGRDYARIPTRHFLDALLSLAYPVFGADENIFDLGSGAGFPGLPLAICRPDLHVHLIESNRKKGHFLQHMKDHLRLKNVTLLPDRVEHLAQSYAQAFDAGTARAVAPLDTLVAWGFPLLKPGGKLVCYKGPALEEELEKAREAMGRWGGTVTEIYRAPHAPFPITSTLVIISKER
jgi:16S rRNA (guanine527-N7)-methyltransferase